MNERLRSESYYINNNFLKINQFIHTLTNVVEKIDRLVLCKEPSHLRDKISILTFKFCNFQKNNEY